MSNNPSPIATPQKAFEHLMRQMGNTNLSRAKQARKAANALHLLWKRY